MAAFLLTIFGAFLGGLLSLGISHWYYTKGKGLETILNYLSHSLSETMIRQQFRQFFGAEAYVMALTAPEGRAEGEPYVEEIRFETIHQGSGRIVSGLYRVVDEGWDHPVVGATSLRVLGSEVPLQYVGFGHSMFTFRIPPDYSERSVELAFTLSDTAGHTTRQMVSVKLGGRCKHAEHQGRAPSNGQVESGKP